MRLDNSDLISETFVVKTDTIIKYINTPVPNDSVVIKYVTVKSPLLKKDTAKNIVDTTSIDAVNKEELAVLGSTSIDSTQIHLPITQKLYQDSTYKAWVSGYMAKLDSICIMQPATTTTRTITNTQIVYKSKRWSLGIQVGAGLTPHKIEPYIGIGITYNFFSW